MMPATIIGLKLNRRGNRDQWNAIVWDKIEG